MYTTENEIIEQIANIQYLTLRPVWDAYAAKYLKQDPLEQLKSALLKIKDSKDRQLQKEATQILVNMVDIDVEVEPIITLNF